jgi:hypothetical protein
MVATIHHLHHLHLLQHQNQNQHPNPNQQNQKDHGVWLPLTKSTADVRENHAQERKNAAS